MDMEQGEFYNYFHRVVVCRKYKVKETRGYENFI